MTLANLKYKAKSAVLWSGFDTFLRTALNFVVVVIMARLLAPEDFGTIALLALFMGLADVFLNAGFSSALIQKKDVSYVDESTVFWINIGLGLMMTLVLISIAPLIASFFALPILIPLTKLMACNILFRSLGSVHNTLLAKRLDFKTPIKVGAISIFVSGCVGVYMAWIDYGVWALAVQVLTATVFDTVLLWIFFPWRPAFIFSFVSFKRLFVFSGYLFMSGLLNTVYQRGYTLLLGKFYGTYDLGIYKRAENTQNIPSLSLARMFSRVTFPLFSSVNSDKERLRRGVRLSVRSIMLITAPTMAGLAVLAEPFIQVTFGEKWLPAVPILQVLCIVGLFLPLQHINIHALQAQGHAKLHFRLEIIKKSIGVVLLILGSIIGIMGVAWASALQSVIELIINTHYTKKYLDYGIRQQILDCLPTLLLSVLMIVIVVLTDVNIEIGGVIELLLLIALGATFYLMSNVLLGISAFKDGMIFIKARK